jgi:nitrate/nitrite transport system permease protein
MRTRAALGSLLLLAVFLSAWQLATLPPPTARGGDPEYAALLGGRKSGLPAPAQIAEAAWAQLKSPFHDGGMNDKGIAIQLAWSLGRVLLGFALAALVAIPVGFLVGMSPVAHRALNPYIQLLKPISPLAWMPLALYTIKDSSVSSVFVISICSLWPIGSTSRARSRSPRCARRSTSSCRRPPPPSSPACASRWASPGW